jgi:hypothetical protein
MSNSREEFTSLHPNRLSFVMHSTGKKGRIVHKCKLNKARFITIKTPEWKPGMTPDEARSAWVGYLSSFQPRSYPPR